MSTVKTNNAQIGQSLTATNNFTWYQPASPDGTVRLGVGNSGATSLDAVTINSSGNLGLGVTPSAWNTAGYKAMDLGTTSSIYYDPGTTAAVLSNNSYINAAYSYIYKTSTFATRYNQEAGQHKWFTAPSGTAGNAISFTQAMTLDASGNLGVGTSSPSYKLQVGLSSDTYSFFSTLSTGGQPRFGTKLDGTNNVVLLDTYGASTNPALAFSTSQTERMRIDSSGNLLVGTTSALGKLAVVGSGTTGGTYACSIYNSGTALTMFLARDDGFVFLPSTTGKTTGSAANLYIDSGNGAVYRSTSSLKYKQNIQNAVHGLAEVLQLRAVTYEGKSETDSGKTFGGLIAEEVHDAGLTEFVQYADDGTPDALAYGNMVSLCIKAIQELKAELDTTKAEVAALKGM